MSVQLRERRGDWMQTYTGRQFWPLDPRPEDIYLEDIAHALSLLCRYAGHVSEFYSVGQHSILVSQNVPREDAAWGLLHDATEAYLVDIPRPLKKHLIGYAEAEDRLSKVIGDRFGLPWPMPATVKEADNAILVDEKALLMGPEPAPWGIGKGIGIRFEPLDSVYVERRFLQIAWELGLS